MKRLAVPLIAVIAFAACETPTSVPDGEPHVSNLETAAENLVGHWKFDEGSGTVTADASGNGNNGTLMNGPIWVPGHTGTALSFDGDDDFVLVPDDDALEMPGDFTISVWVNWTNFNRDAEILRKGNTLNADDWYLIEVQSDLIKVRLNGTNGNANLFDNQTRADGIWHHIAVVRDASTRLYIDGNLIDSTLRTGGVISNNRNLAFGAKDTGDDDNFNGLIDDVRLYNRALTAEEISELANSGDDTPPTVPQNVAASPLSSTEIQVTWDASSDPESGVSSYKVYRDGVFAGESTTSPFTDSGLAPATTYTYEVSAVNGAGLESAKGGPAQATTLLDDTPPTVPQNVAANPLSAFQIQVSWDPSSDPESGVSSYKIYRDGVFVGESPTSPFTDSGLTPATTYSYEVSAVNGAGLESAKGGPTQATTPFDDDTPAAVPQNVAANPLSAFQIEVSWDPSSDPESGVSSYKIYRDGVFVGESPTSPFTDSGLTPSTTYTYEVTAVNGAGLESAKGGPAQATTLPFDGPPGIVGHWKFDEGSGILAGDDSGNGNTGTLMNGPVWVPGRTGTALSFDGSNDYVLVLDDDAIDLPGDLTMALWVNWTDESNAELLRKGSSANSEDWYTLEIQLNKIQVRLNGTQGNATVYDNQTRNDGIWHHVAVVRDAASTRLYVDGVFISSTRRTGGDLSNSANLAFGAFDTGDKDFYEGLLDDIRFYNRALTDQEISDLANLGV